MLRLHFPIAVYLAILSSPWIWKPFLWNFWNLNFWQLKLNIGLFLTDDKFLLDTCNLWLATIFSMFYSHFGNCSYCEHLNIVRSWPEYYGHFRISNLSFKISIISLISNLYHGVCYLINIFILLEFLYGLMSTQSVIL